MSSIVNHLQTTRAGILQQMIDSHEIKGRKVSILSNDFLGAGDCGYKDTVITSGTFVLSALITTAFVLALFGGATQGELFTGDPLILSILAGPGAICFVTALPVFAISSCMRHNHLHEKLEERAAQRFRDEMAQAELQKGEPLRSLA